MGRRFPLRPARCDLPAGRPLARGTSLATDSLPWHCAGHVVPEYPMAGLTPATRTTRAAPRRDPESTLKLADFRLPQKAQLRRALPASGDWLYEVKYDGYRAQAAIAGDRVRIYSSSGIDWTGKQFAWLAPAFLALGPGPLLIDGEVCTLDDQGRPDFGRLKVSLDGKHPLIFYAFDPRRRWRGSDAAAPPRA